MTINDLKFWQDKVVVLSLRDGEVTTAKVNFVDSEYEDIIVTVLASNRHYERPSERAFTIAAVDISSIEEANLDADAEAARLALLRAEERSCTD
jgi:hypothetical protein